MSDDHEDGIGTLAGTDFELLERAPGGALSEAGRQAAVVASLSLLGVYFSSGNYELIERPAIDRSTKDHELDALSAGLRLRVALAAGRRLASLLDKIVKRPTFRYELQSTAHVGSLSGAIDINRWITQSRGDQELTFPVLEVKRGLHTPENVLAAYAVSWLLKELHVSFEASLATPDVIEYETVRQLRERLIRTMTLPALANCIRSASTIRTQAALLHLVSNVKRRLRRRDIANARPYGELTGWIDDCLNGQPVVSPGEVEFSVYGDRFDSKLFELWCLGALGRQLATTLNLPEPSISLDWRRGAPAYTLHAFSGRIDIYFQRGLRAVDERYSARWVKDTGRPLGGIPDIVVRAGPVIGDGRFALIDPKLRQRARAATDELYKVLGYLQNFDVTPAVGIVLIYTTATDLIHPDVFHDGLGGSLMSVALNPAAALETTRTALQIVARPLLRLIDYQLPDQPTYSMQTDVETGEDRAECVIDEVKSSMKSWGSAHLGEVSSSCDRVEALIGSVRWHALNNDVQIMMATADLVGHRLDPAADFSGPVIGMCAAVEYVLYASAISPIVGNDPVRERRTRTFGAVLDAVELACRSQGTELHHEIKAHLIASGIELNNVVDLLQPWRSLNRCFRIPAAHREVLTKLDWQRLYRLLLGPDSLLIRTFDALLFELD
jgi:hypothetical protein